MTSLSWQLAPATPAVPGLYAVLQTTVPGDTPRFLRWTGSGAGWRLGARREPVVAFLGPIPDCRFPHAEVEHLFSAPANPGRHPPASRTHARVSGTRNSR